ncbi:sensor histidine kinase [Paenibacillus yanchengensis]|uniref:Sensor histidine kinase n=1 Tax=Paenibacillus yanchengensis TaxID=2035833 RepID=A0ABW4YI17_9BACL
MKAMRDQIRFNTLPKIIFAMLLVVTPIYGVGLFMNQSAEQNLREQLSRSVASKLQFYVSSLETEVNRLTRLNQELMFDSDFQKLMTIAHAMDDFTRAQTILAVKTKLDLLKTSSPYVENVKVYIPSLDRGIFANSFDNHIPREELEAIELSARFYESSLTYWNGQLLLSEVYPAPNEKVKPTLALGVEMSWSQLRLSLEQLSDMEGAGATIIHADQKWHFANNDEQSEWIMPEVKATLAKLTSESGLHSGQTVVDIQQQPYLLSYEYSPTLHSYLAVYVPEEKLLGPLSKYRNFLWFLTGIAIVVMILFAGWIYRLLHQPLKGLVVAFRKVEKGDLNVSIERKQRDEFQYLYLQFNAMVSKLQLLIQEVYEERIQVQQSELKQLQSQINPHFLYNSLYIAKGLVQMEDHYSAEKLLSHLGQYFMFITKTSSGEVTLAQEFAHAKAYADIQNMRFFNRIAVVWPDIPEQWQQVIVPRLIVQPMIENAYEHGVEAKVEDGRLHVSVEQYDEKTLWIIVEDNGESVDESRLWEMNQLLQREDKVQERTGLYNVHRRLQIKYGDQHGVFIQKSSLGGLKVILSIAMEVQTDV